MIRLSVNLNKIALLRNSRGSDYPNVKQMAERAIAAGALGITVHPRPDQRHIRLDDVPVLAELCAGLDDVEYNIEGNPTEAFLELVIAVRPDQCTLVPDDPNQLTSDHGFNLDGDNSQLAASIARLKEQDIRVSVFMDPEPAMIDRVPDTGADRIELYTESYARAFGGDQEDIELARFVAAARRAGAHGLGVNAGHDLNLKNLARFAEEVPGLIEVSIGHAIWVESLDLGLEETLRRYRVILE